MSKPQVLYQCQDCGRVAYADHDDAPHCPKTDCAEDRPMNKVPHHG